MIIDHIGIVVPSLEQAISKWEKAVGYCQMTEPVVNSRQKVRVVFLQKEGSVTIKLVEPVDSTSTVFQLARKGGGLHHICFKAGDMESAIQHLKAEGAKVLVAPEPGEAFESEPIAFLYLLGLPAELIATDKKARLIAPQSSKGPGLQ
jgi:methylmalonyl-CoA/ethylmalonyl-CoA epimerase